MNNINLNNMAIDPPPQMAPSRFSECPQCGLIHPPLRQGEKCPNAKIIVKDESGKEVKVETEKFLVMIKNIIMSKIDNKKMSTEQVEKIFADLTVNTVQYLEKYKIK